MGNISRICLLPSSLTIVCKSLNYLWPPYMKNIFQYVTDVSNANLQSAANLKLYVPKTHLKVFDFKSGPTIWNNLKSDAGLAKSLRNLMQLYNRTPAKALPQNSQSIKTKLFVTAHFVYVITFSVVCLTASVVPYPRSTGSSVTVYTLYICSLSSL